MNNLHSLLEQLFAENELLYAILSSPHDKAAKCKKITLRPFIVNQSISYQITEFHGTQALHKNLSREACQSFLEEQIQSNFKQSLFCAKQSDYQILNNKKRITILKKPPSKTTISLTHNRQKEYLLNEDAPFLLELGITRPDGKIKPDKNHKYRQLNRFLELIDDVLPHFKTKKKLHIIDFGCGKAYLTFALYHYLVNLKKYEVQILGLDLKEEVIAFCQKLAEKLGYSGLEFKVGDINKYSMTDPLDMVISLHACDTATDAVLEKAIRWNAEVILCVPCCQHELIKQVSSTSLSPLLQHGILKERFAALVTDAARAQLLEILGYQTQVLEFIDLEHTPKNLLIRAIKRASPKDPKDDLQAYANFKHALNITPSLERRFGIFSHSEKNS